MWRCRRERGGGGLEAFDCEVRGLEVEVEADAKVNATWG